MGNLRKCIGTLSLVALPVMGCLDSEQSRVINSKEFQKTMSQYEPKGNSRLERKMDQIDRALYVADSLFQIQVRVQDSLNPPVITYGKPDVFIPSRDLPKELQDSILRGLFEERFGKGSYDSTRSRLGKDYRRTPNP